MSSSKEKSKVKQNRFLEIWKQFRRNKGAMFGLVVLILLILIAVFADVIWDYDTDITAMQVGDRLLKPCLAHPFGTDNYGRDMPARIGYGTRSLWPSDSRQYLWEPSSAYRWERWQAIWAENLIQF